MVFEKGQKMMKKQKYEGSLLFKKVQEARKVWL